MPYCGDKVYILTKEGDIKAGILSTAFFGMEDAEYPGIKVGISYPHPDGTFDYEEMDASVFAVRGYATIERAKEAQVMMQDKETRDAMNAMEDVATFLQGLRGIAKSINDIAAGMDPDELEETLNQLKENLDSGDMEYNFYPEDDEDEGDEDEE